MFSGPGGDSSGHVFISEAQLAGGAPAIAFKISDAFERTSAEHIGKPFTSWMKAVTSSLMHAEYCATVAVQVAGRSLQPRLSAHGSALPRHEVSLFVQLVCSCASVGALLDAP